MDWRLLWLLALGREPDTDYVPPYVASLIFFFINMATGVVQRALTRLLVPVSVRGHVLDFLCTMEACAYFFENNFVVKHYGNFWLAVAIIGQLYVCSRTFGDGFDSPVKAFHEWLLGHLSWRLAVVKIAVMSLAGLASYRLARLIWSLDLIEDHHERFYEVDCSSDLEVTLLTGMIIEGAATLSDTWLGLQTVSSLGLLDEFIKYLNAALMIVYGLHTTGMYFNPAMASGHTLGCGSTRYWEHFVVYWAGPFLGCFLATLCDRLLHVDVTKLRESSARDKKD
ncbi:aquaporin-11-like [Pomacea canaliculata]|uniref:aquaporin-11-like n=1 Tax=Pomacea canaliculata TaxID=400727 RepID=UPI000D734E47|nr:aquaporin-11-like [Pomacea canaliculata]XP_025096424.1 aquaporin-11-like [Pomacea canaliculata]